MHIISFDVPYPPNYGGVIDVFYKLKNLAEQGVEIYLHTYEFGRGRQKELDKYCKKVYYYTRGNFFINLFSRKPFTAKTRNDKTLIENLNKDSFPILFEGLKTTYPLIKNDFSNRKILIRTHNIEHYYYKGLRKSETSKLKKIFFEIEAKKLKSYESILLKADYILTISKFEQLYFNHRFGSKTIYIPVFYNHKFGKLNDIKDKFILWHGDLRVSDNYKSALFMIDVFANLKHNLVIASSFKNKKVIKEISRYKNISFDILKKETQLDLLFETAHIHTLLTFQKTGIKLKLLNVLCRGKFIIANTLMIEDTGLEGACHLANTKKEFKDTIEKLIQKDYKKENSKKRLSLLQDLNPVKSAKRIIELL